MADKIYINTDRPASESVVKSENRPTQTALLPSFVVGASKDVELYFVKNDGTFDTRSGDGGEAVKVSVGRRDATPTGGSGTLSYTGYSEYPTSEIAYGATSQTIEDALNAIEANVPTASLVDVTKQSDTLYTVINRSYGEAVALTGTSIDLTPESSVTPSISVAGSDTQRAQQIIEIQRQPAIYESDWTAITDGFSGTLDANNARVAQSLQSRNEQPFILEISIGGDVVCQVPCEVKQAITPPSAFPPDSLPTALAEFAANPSSQPNFDADTWYNTVRVSGWASYIDNTSTIASPYVVLADTDTHFQIESDSIIETQKPTDVTTFYTGSPDYKITGRSGDNLDVMLYFKAVPSSPNQWMDIWIDIEGAVGELYRQTFSFPKGSGIERGILYALPSAYTLDTWQANGGKIYVRSNEDLDIYDINLNLDRSHKSIT